MGDAVVVASTTDATHGGQIVADDIVTRLYAYECDGHEAANEIERLRTALHLAAGLLSSCAPYDQMHPNRVLELLTGERHHDHHEST